MLDKDSDCRAARAVNRGEAVFGCFRDAVFELKKDLTEYEGD